MNDTTNYESNNVYFYSIKVIDKQRNTIEFLNWRNIPLKTYYKFFWYYKYRSALLQVKYPRFEIIQFWGVDREPSVKSQELILKNKIISRKRKISEMNNKVNYVIKNWNELFSYEEEPIYLKFIEKKNKAEKELNELIIQYEKIKTLD